MDTMSTLATALPPVDRTTTPRYIANLALFEACLNSRHPPPPPPTFDEQCDQMMYRDGITTNVIWRVKAGWRFETEDIYYPAHRQVKRDRRRARAAKKLPVPVRGVFGKGKFLEIVK